MKRYFIFLSFNGKCYAGWQRQKNAVTVQEVLENRLSILLRHDVAVTGAGRTDTGVHASYFVAHFDTEGGNIQNTDDFVYKLNSFLPTDISIKELKEVKTSAHARFDALSRTYTYQIAGSKNPFETDFCYYIQGNKFRLINMDLFNEGCELLKTHSDFSSFARKGSDVKTHICKLYEAYATKEGEKIIFTIKADRFLRNMVRAITGTLLDLAMAKMSIPEFEAVIASMDRSKAGTSAPPEGLFLSHIEYPKGIFI